MYMTSWLLTWCTAGTVTWQQVLSHEALGNVWQHASCDVKRNSKCHVAANITWQLVVHEAWKSMWCGSTCHVCTKCHMIAGVMLYDNIHIVMADIVCRLEAYMVNQCTYKKKHIKSMMYVWIYHVTFDLSLSLNPFHKLSWCCNCLRE